MHTFLTQRNAALVVAVFTWLFALKHPSRVSAITPCPAGVQIYTVYNCFIWPSQDWELLIRSQLDHLRQTGLTDCANTNVVLSVPAFFESMTYEELEDLLDSGRRLVQSILPAVHSGKRTGIIVSQVHENSYEFPGLHLLWRLAQGISKSGVQDSIFLYFHSKGMVNYGRHTARPAVEAELFRRTIVPWRNVVRLFQGNNTLTRIGVFPASGGWMWQNFWWARGSYIVSLEEPIRTRRRFYYEDWLGRLYDNATTDSAEPGRFAGCNTCYSLNGDCSGYEVVYGQIDQVIYCPEDVGS